MVGSLPVINLAEAKYECTFGRGCEGVCCQHGRPPIWADEVETLDANLERMLPELRPEARRVVERQGYLSRRLKLGLPMLRVVGGWCVFFNQGCVLHKVGAAEGDKYRYKPLACSVFPLCRDDEGNWYVRQVGYKKEKWNLCCLDPSITTAPAAETLREEMDLARRNSVEWQDDEAAGPAVWSANGLASADEGARLPGRLGPPDESPAAVLLVAAGGEKP